MFAGMEHEKSWAGKTLKRHILNKESNEFQREGRGWSEEGPVGSEPRVEQKLKINDEVDRKRSETRTRSGVKWLIVLSFFHILS